MTRKFLAKYFSSAKTGKFRREIHNFCQNETETVFEAWEKFMEIVRKYQHNEIELRMQLQDFWDGLTLASHRILSNAAGGTLMKKTLEEIVIILDELSEDANQWPSEIAGKRRSTGVHQVDANTSVQVQLDAVAKEIRKLTLDSIHNEPHAACDICGRGHPTHECQASTEEVNTVGNYNFIAIGQKHHSFSWSSLGVQQMHGNKITPDFKELLTNERLDSHGAAIKELGTSTLPADTEKNPKKTVNVVTLRSGQVLKDATPSQKEAAPEKESGKELKIEDDKKTEKKKGKKGAEKKKKEETSRRGKSNDVSKHMPALPFPQKLYGEKVDKQ
ncbi:PREDICTED: uncharacterized protein LOC109224178 [Nicotiana attenuata]|uniref:uncharacterized protein LOC109224178 n=1 Tax=Nicotiana attenuata TaxID=49451 RepID=UPI0009049EA8|nr:PREDICTED: uncharacterized protein LOC109224178 [Nicotiana attenuata]